jgi:hypothetical protein
VDFGDVELGAEPFREFPVCNDGTSLLAIRAIVLPEGFWLPWDEVWEWEGPTVSPGGCYVARVFHTDSLHVLRRHRHG